MWDKTGMRKMQGDKTRARHDALMHQMAETLGADLDRAEMRGALPPEAREERCFWPARAVLIRPAARIGWPAPKTPMPRLITAATAMSLAAWPPNRS